MTYLASAVASQLRTRADGVCRAAPSHRMNCRIAFPATGEVQENVHAQSRFVDMFHLGGLSKKAARSRVTFTLGGGPNVFIHT